MSREEQRRPASQGDGPVRPELLRRLGEGVIFESGVRLFHPENIEIGDRVYVGHDTILKGYHDSLMHIGAGCWIGQQCFFHSGGGLTIGRDVGVGPGVRIITSTHRETGRELPILHAPLEFEAVHVGDGCDIGVSAVLLPGVCLGRGVQVAAGAVVRGEFPDFAVLAGVPAQQIRTR